MGWMRFNSLAGAAICGALLLALVFSPVALAQNWVATATLSAASMANGDGIGNCPQRTADLAVDHGQSFH